MSVSFHWIDLRAFLDDKIEYRGDEITIPRNYIVEVKINEITSYRFDVEKLVELDLSDIHEKEIFPG
ncbi:hypothetical protein KEJ49_07970 [Candidatus Bathyarchaeota archaeon]|nr:hypothetical protein [Candidatus Bathyarchaeota archaeon]